MVLDLYVCLTMQMSRDCFSEEREESHLTIYGVGDRQVRNMRWCRRGLHEGWRRSPRLRSFFCSGALLAETPSFSIGGGGRCGDFAEVSV